MPILIPVTESPLNDTRLSELVQSLPASPRLLAELGAKLRQNEVPLPEVTALLRRDAALTARLISIANSAVYARAEPATSLEEAVACIGYHEVYRLVGAIAAHQIADEPLSLYGIEAHRFRENALFAALVMEELSAPAGVEPREAYTMGLLRSIGKVALDRAARGGARVRPLGADEPVTDWEKSNWGCTNAEVAARILDEWRFPEETSNSVREHYEPGPNAPVASHLLNMAAGAADLRGFGFPGEELYWQFTPLNFSRAGIDAGKLVWVGERAFQTLTRIRSALA